jgi:hypothetical protein
MSLIEGYRKNVWTITVTDQTFRNVFKAFLTQNGQKIRVSCNLALEMDPGEQLSPRSAKLGEFPPKNWVNGCTGPA